MPIQPQFQKQTIRSISICHSTHDVLRRLDLHIQSVNILADRVVFHVSFTNHSLERFGFNIGPNARDAWFLDSMRRQFQPTVVSASLEDSITPAEGLAPGEEYPGTITFARPESLSELRFLFTQYTLLHSIIHYCFYALVKADCLMHALPRQQSMSLSSHTPHHHQNRLHIVN